MKMIIQQIFPTTFSNNWYMTCYLLFYAIHPFLNWIIKKMKQAELLRFVLWMLFLYVGMNFIKGGLFFSSPLILWTTIYFTIAYMKLYLIDFSNNVKINLGVFAIGFVGNYGIILLMNVLGLHIGALSDQLGYWGSNCSPFLISMVIGMLNIARNVYFQNNVVNYISKLSLLIYLIHENILLRTFYRPMMWQYVYNKFGYAHIIGWFFILVFLVFTFGLIASILYHKTVQRFVTKIGNFLYLFVEKLYTWLECQLMKLH